MGTPAGDDDERCGVCLDIVNSRGTLDSCAHAFCAQCILDWAQVESKCPVCRGRFTSVTRHGEQPVAVARTNQVFEWDGTVFADESDALDDVVCDICGEGDREDELLLCRRFEVCGASAHASCLGLTAPPEEDWECYRCAASTRRRARATAARASALASPAATGVSPQEQARLSAEYMPVSGDALDLEAPPSPREDESTVRRWVLRQRSIARSSFQSGSQNTEPSRAALRAASLRTVRQMRENWSALRSGSISFDAVGAAGAPGPRQAGALRLRQAAAPATHEAPADASQLSWQALEELRQQEQRRSRAPRGQPRVRVPPAPAQPTDGFLAHLSGMRRMREGVQEDAPPQRRPCARPLAAASEAAPAQPRAGPPTRSFIIPRKQ
jgi:hypothetical protein